MTHVTKRRVPYTAELPLKERQAAAVKVMRNRESLDDMWDLLEHLGLVTEARDLLLGRLQWTTSN